MAYFSWVAQENSLSAAALTVRAQTISPNDEGRLLWDAFFPRRDVPSVKLDTISNVDFRPVADRREWNARGRLIPTRMPNVGLLEMVPIESYFQINEREIQELEERTLGNEALFRQLVGVDIPTRTDALASANYRRIEVDTFTAWALGQITARNPVMGNAVTVSYGFAAARYETAGTAWQTVGNAWTEFLAWLARAIDLVGPIQGVMLRLNTLKEIQTDAPNPFVPAGSNIPVTRAQLEQRVQDELGSEFTFYVNENTHDIFGDGGLSVTRTKVWPAGRIAAIPSGEQIGYQAFAPVARAFEVARAAPNAQIDVRGMTVYVDTSGVGRQLTVECQANAIPVPIEANVAVINTQVP